MILDRLENRKYYEGAHRLFAEGFSYIEAYLQHPVSPGVYEIDGTDLFAKVQTYMTRERGFFETHDRHIDIQYVVSGTEKICCCSKAGLVPHGAYDAAEDMQLYEDGNRWQEFTLSSGEFAVFFPEDVHKGALAAEGPCQVEKIVLKVSL